MTAKTRLVSLFISIGTALLFAAFFAWLFSLEGSKGLGQWGWNKVYIAIALAGILPLILSLAALPSRKPETSRLAAALSIASLVLSIVATAGILVTWGEILIRARSLEKPVPALNLVDPSKGIVPGGPTDAKGQAVLRLAFSSDPHWGADSAYTDGRSAILKSVAGERPARDAFYILGDNVQMGMNDAEWHAEATELAATLGSLPVGALIGNHDAIIDGQYHYKAYFFPPRLHSDSGSSFYWSMDAGPAVIVALDLLWGAESFDPSRRAWLEKTLAAVPAGKRIIVLSHCFFASSGYMDGTEPWFDHFGTLAIVAPILEKYHVDLVLQGHNHYMETLERNGVTYATIGAMGGKPDPEPSHVSPWSTWFSRGTYGYLNLDVTVAGIKLEFKDASGKVVHTASVAPTR